ncbi:MAG TPA: prepilin-type N-terminal cleavage/methylation domain-containing protein [Actinobacteria bacterium]|nr:prepilin-type N-terminal cleavage/methylation domain-containing protein [Actinomycetota bacterium]
MDNGMKPNARSDRGFTVIEVAVALAILGTVIVMTIGPISSGFDILRKANQATIGTNIAQGRIEELRSLAYEDVGYTSSVPSGVLQPSQTVTVNGLDFTVDTDIKYFGSINPGEDIIPQGGDGVQGHFDSGIDYKQVVVTVSRAGSDFVPIVMTTIIAPPSLAANDNKANVIVNLVKVEPDGASPSILPFPKVYLVNDTSFVVFPGAPDATQIFAGVDANTSSGVDYYYYGRLGGSMGSLESGGWRIHPGDVGTEAERVHVPPTESGTMTLRIYHPAILHIEMYDQADGSEIGGPATLTLTEPLGVVTFTETSSEWNGSGWDITEADGAPLMPGSYSFSLLASGYSQVDRPDVLVPSGYPDSADHTETFTLTAAVGFTLTMHVQDAQGVPIRDVGLTIVEPGGTSTATTDQNGDATRFVEGSMVTVTVTATSPFGHEPLTRNVMLSSDQTLTLTLTTPSGYGLITFTDNNQGVEHYEYLPRNGSPDDIIRVYPNVNGQGSAAVAAGYWSLTKACLNGSSKSSNWWGVYVSAGTTKVWSTSSSMTCPAS